jgi:putative hydroxymethylpyrimidine transport system substrate-binding protein
VTLDGRPGPENVGVLMAKQRGFFRAAGLHVWIGTPASPEYPAVYVEAGGDDIGIAPQPEVARVFDREAAVVAVGTVIPQSTAAMIWLEGSGIDDLSDLKGTTIAILGVPFQYALLESVLAQAGLDKEDVVVLPGGYELVTKILSGEVDAIFGGSWNLLGPALEARGAEPVITRMEDLGVPAYDEQMVVARSECAAQNPALIRSFMRALLRGTEAAIKDPAKAARLIAESPGSDPEASAEETRAAVDATLPLLSTSGYVDPVRAENLVAWMHEEGMLETELPVSSAFTNRYLETP